MTYSECIQCGKKSADPEVWSSGEVCLFGTLFACSTECAEAWAQKNAKEGWRPGEPHYYADVEP